MLPDWGWVHRLSLRRQALGSLLAGRPAVRRLAAGAATLAVMAAAVAVITTQGHPQYRRSAGSSAGTAQQWFASRRAITITRVHHRLLGVRSGWELLALGTGWEPGAAQRAAHATLVRIQFAEGRITRTAFPALISEGLSAFVAGPHGAISLTYDGVTGYLVPDGRPARPLPPALEHGGPAFPGPLPGQLWVTSAPAGRLGVVLSLVTMNGTPIGPTMRLPDVRDPSVPYLSVPDGRGYVLLQGPRAVYDARPAGLRRVAAGMLAAVGPGGWLVSHCSSASNCGNVVISPATGARRRLPGSASLAGYPVPAWQPGRISPDTRFAALVRSGRHRTAILDLVDLRTGGQRRVVISRSAPGWPGWPGIAWSPDSRWLFVTTATGALKAIDPRTGAIRGLGVTLPPVTYLAVRNPG